MSSEAALGPSFFRRAALAVFLSVIHAAAWVLSPFRIGRLLRSVSLPRLAERPLRTCLTTLGIASGVAGVLAVLLVNRSVIAAATDTAEQIAGKADLEITAGATGFEDSLVDTITAAPGVLRATPVIQRAVRIREEGAKGERLMLFGVDLVGESEGYFRHYDSPQLGAIKDDPLTFLDATNHLLLSRAMGERLHRKLHDTVRLETPQGTLPFEIWGFVNDDSGPARSFGGALAVMHYQSMQAAFERGTSVDRVDVAVAPGASVEGVADALRAKLGVGFAVRPPAEAASRIAGMLGSLQAALTAAGTFSLQIGLFLIYNTILISVVQRKRELGILRSLGLKGREATLLLTLEGGLLGLIGSVLGVFLGVLLAHAMLKGVSESVSQLYVQVAATEVKIDAKVVAGCLAFGVAASVIAAAIPARAASRLRPVEILRTGGMMSTQARASRVTAADVVGVVALLVSFPLAKAPPYHGQPIAAWGALGTLLIAGSALVPRVIEGVNFLYRRFVGDRLGVEMQMANENMPRDLARTAVTAGALGAGVCMATSFGVFLASFIASMTSWVDQSLPAELFITSSGPLLTSSASMSKDLGVSLATLPGVEAVERERLVPGEFRGSPIRIRSTDEEISTRYAHLLLLEGSQPEATALVTSGRGAFISENFSRKFNLHRGDTFALNGQQENRFEVAAVVIDYTSDLGTVSLDRATYVSGWGDDVVDMYKIHAPHAEDLGAMRRTINERFGEKYDLSVLTGREYKAEILALLQRIFGVLRALQGVALVIAALGVVNALSANVLDRVREVGVLRALGMSRARVQRLVMGEAALVGLCGVIMGVAAGLASGYVLVVDVGVALTGWRFAFNPPWGTTLELGALIILVATVAGFYPARTASRLPVTDALSYE